MFTAKSPQKLFRQKAYDFNGLADSLQHPFRVKRKKIIDKNSQFRLTTCSICYIKCQRIEKGAEQEVESSS